MCAETINYLKLILAFIVYSLSFTDKFQSFFLKWRYVNCERRYTDLLKSLKLEYSRSWKETIFDLNKISVLVSWNSALSVNTNSWIGGYQRFFITVSTTCPSQNFGKYSWKYWLSGFLLCLCWIWYYWTKVYHWFYTLNSMTQLDDDWLFHRIMFLSQS